MLLPAACIAIYSAERRGQAGAELLLCSGERGYIGDWAYGEPGKGALDVPGAISCDMIVLFMLMAQTTGTCTVSALEEPLQLKKKRWPQAFLILKLQRCKACCAAVLGIICCVPVEHAGVREPGVGEAKDSTRLPALLVYYSPSCFLFWLLVPGIDIF